MAVVLTEIVFII